MTSLDIKPVEHHDLVPCSDKIPNEFGLSVGAAIYLGNGPELGVRAKHQIGASSSPPLATRLTVDTGPELTIIALCNPSSAHVEEIYEEIIRQLARALGEDAIGVAVPVRIECAQTTDEDGQLGWGQAEKVRLVDEILLDLDACRRLAVVAEAVNLGLKVVDGVDLGLLLRGICAARGEGHCDIVAGVPGSLLDSGGTGKHDGVGQRNLLATRRGAVELLLHALNGAEDLLQLLWVVGGPVLLRLEADSCTVGATTLVAASEGRRGAPGGCNEAVRRHTRGQQVLFELGDILVVD